MRSNARATCAGPTGQKASREGRELPEELIVITGYCPRLPSQITRFSQTPAIMPLQFFKFIYNDRCIFNMA